MTLLTTVLCHPHHSVMSLVSLRVTDGAGVTRPGLVTLGHDYYDLMADKLGLELHVKTKQLYAITWDSEQWEYSIKSRRKRISRFDC